LVAAPDGLRVNVQEPLLLRTLRCEPVERTPIWLMRQAGRYLPEYQALREQHSFIELCRTPELAIEATLQPIRRFGLDAAIIFSDILLVLDAMGVGVHFDDSGPVIEHPYRSRRDLRRLRVVEPEADLGFVAEAIRATVAELPAEVPLIGFAGAPFTLLSYLMEGRGERGLAAARALLLRDPETAEVLLRRLSDAVVALLQLQVTAGARVVQLFDTWAGVLTLPLWRQFAMPHARRITEAMGRLDVPTIYFARGSSLLLPKLHEVGATGYGMDWLCDLDTAREALGPKVALQGNLDPAVLLTSPEVVRKKAESVLDQAGGEPGHVFNLGHGVMPQTDPDLVDYLVQTVWELSEAEES